MHIISKKAGGLILLAIITVPMSVSLSAQQQDSVDPIIVQGSAPPEAPVSTQGPEIKGIITARNGDRMKVTTADGTNIIIAINDATRIKAGGALLNGRNKLATDALLNGLPVTVKTLQSGEQLMASQISLRNKDLKTATMIRNGTAQGFAEQTAATEALRGRVGDIDQYNIKGTTNVNFDTGKAVLSEQGKADLCAAVSTADAMKNAQILVIGYTDSTGSDDFNQQLSEKRASRVVNYIQQACGWKPYRMLTPTGMAKADPLASNDTAEGKAQNRRVSLNVLVSKGLDGL